MAKPMHMIHNKPTAALQDGKCVTRIASFPVRVLAVAEGYAMVRRPRAMPYVCRESELAPIKD